MFVEKKTAGHYRQVSVAQRNSKMWCHGKGREEGTQLQCMSVQLFYDIGDQQKMVVCRLCHLPLTVKDMQLANPLVLI